MRKLILHLNAFRFIIVGGTIHLEAPMKQTKISPLLKKILDRYRQIPAQLRSPKTSERSKAQRLITVTLCIPLLLYFAGYMLVWQIGKSRVETDNAAYSELYQAAEEVTVQPEITAAPLPEPTAEPTGGPTDILTQAPTEAPTDAPTATPTAEPTEAPTQAPTAAPAETAIPMDIPVDEAIFPMGTPDADTLVFALETPPPVQESFQELLELNEETIGFLKVGSHISLPVVQRKNDNDYYLNHSFEHESSNAGTLFLDGSNLLVPEDPNLIIYGHNMKNGTMFHPLIAYSELPALQKMDLVQFDTIYENRKYVPFAVFSATTEPGSDRYLDIRQFVFDEQSHELFVLKMQKYSMFDIPIEVNYDDNILLLVTCEYVYDSGRFIIALREVRPGEDETQLKQLLMQSKYN